MKAIAWTLLVSAFATLGSHAEDKGKKAQKQYEENVRIASRYPFREFEQAAKSGDIATVKRLLDQGVPVSLQIPWPEDSFEGIPPFEQAIHHAAANDQLEAVRLLLDRGADPNAHGGEGDLTPLHLTSNLEIARLLISRGADVSARNEEAWQPIHSAASESLELVKLLVKHGADPLARDDCQTQPIHIAADRGSAEVVSFLLSRKANVGSAVHAKEGYFRNGWQPLHFAANRQDDSDVPLRVAQLLIRNGADVNAVTAEGETPLHLSKNAAMTKLLLQHGAKPDVMSTGIIKEQPIHHFAMEGDAESIKLLLDRGVDIEARSADDDEKSTPLDTAAFWGKTDTVKFLLERGAIPTERTMKNARRFDTNPIEILQLLHQHGGRGSAEMFLLFPEDRKTFLPLLDQQAKDDLISHSSEGIADAAETGDLDLIRDLVSIGARLDQPWEGLLPIHHAVISGKEAVVEYFLAAGQPIDAKGTLRDDDSEPPIVFTDVQPIHLAVGKPELVPFLIGKGAKLDAKTAEGWQPVHLAAAHGEKAMLEAVIKAGGDPSAKTRDGETPLQLAEKFDKKENAEFLRHTK